MKIGVLGCGNMAAAVVERLHAADESADFITYTPSHVRAVALAEGVKGRAVASLTELGPTDMLMIGCKPHQFSQLAEELVARQVPVERAVSLMAAVSVGDIQAALRVDKVTRLMPSLPMRHGEGISLLWHSMAVDAKARNFFQQTLEKCSQVVETASEELLDPLTPITASGPAYIYFLAGVFEGVLQERLGDPVLSRDLAVQLFKGASISMDREGGASLQELVWQVTSQKGVTGEAIESFDENDLKGILYKGIKKAEERLREIKTQYFS